MCLVYRCWEFDSGSREKYFFFINLRDLIATRGNEMFIYVYIFIASLRCRGKVGGKWGT